MKAFQFPLEKVLSFRKRQWEAEAATLESLLANRIHLETQRRQVIRSVEEAATGLGRGTQISSAAISEYRLAHASTREAIRQIDRVLQQLAPKIASQQRACILARRHYELVLRLREKRYAEWLREANREEEANATESFLAGHTRRRLALSSKNS